MRAFAFSFCICLALPVTAEPVDRFAELFALGALEQRARGVMTVPDGVRKVAQLRGMPVFAVEGAAYEGRLAMVTAALAALPKDVERYPAKGLFLSDIRPDVTRSDRVIAYASGPYIVLRKGFFSPKHAEMRALWLAHEWTHVLQYYYAAPADGGPIRAREASTLVAAWITELGWEERPRIGWVLPRNEQAGTTRYGRTVPWEDQAEALARVLLGRADEVSPDRRAFFQRHLGIDADRLAAGRIPLGEGFQRLRVLTPEITSGVIAEGQTPEAVYLWQTEAGLEQAMAGFAGRMAQRGFVQTASDLAPVSGRPVFRGTWQHEGKSVAISAMVRPAGGILLWVEAR